MTPRLKRSHRPTSRSPPTCCPSDGRFGCGPSKVRPEAVAALAAEAPTTWAPATARPPSSSWWAALRNGLAELFALPDGYEVLLGNGGTTVFWDAATFGLIDQRSQHLSFGEFSSKFAEAAPAAPFLGEPESSPRRARHPPAARSPTPSIDLYAPHPQRDLDGRGHAARAAPTAPTGPGGRRRHLRPPAACASTPTEVDVYYFAPQKCLASDGGLWLAAVLARGDRAHRAHQPPRTAGSPPRSTSAIALDNSRKDQTYNTPALATIFLAVQQVEWVNDNGGLEFAAGRCDRSAETIYGWAEAVRATRRPSWPTRPSAATSSPRSTSTTRSTPRRSRRSCAPTASSTPSLPQARPQPAPHRHVPGHRPRRRRRAHRLHRPRRRRPGLTRALMARPHPR